MKSMAWKTIKCPYCGYKKDITVNTEVKKNKSMLLKLHLYN